MEVKQVIEALKAQKSRITPSRKSLVEIFLLTHRPLSVEELNVELAHRGLKFNKTTIYRELDFLKENGIIREIELGEGKKRFENAHMRHHHHMVCDLCRKIEEVESEGVEKILAKFQKELAKIHGYQDIRHSLEFFGVCRSCLKIDKK